MGVATLILLGLSIQTVGLTDCCCGHACETQDRHGQECPGGTCSHLESSQKAQIEAAPDLSFEVLLLPVFEANSFFPSNPPVSSIPVVDTGPPLYLANGSFLI